jgi:hypothetical protein
MRRPAVVALLTCLYAASPTVTSAQEKLPWVEKTVWVASYIETKPGKFNDYIKELSNLWLRYVNKLMHDGYVVSYKMMRVEFARDNEPDLVILIEYKNMAAFDAGTEYMESVVKEIAGSLSQDSKAETTREELRKLRGSLLFREIDFRK